MRRWGLTGGIGSGKSAAADLLRARGVPVLDADRVVREALAPAGTAAAEVAAAFPDCRRPDGGIDRPALARVVFGDPAARERLERILHPRVLATWERWCAEREAEGHRLVFLEATLILEGGLERGLDGVAVVTAPEALRVARAAARDGVPPEAIRARLAAQLGEAERAARADLVLPNAGTLDDLARAVEAALARLAG